MNLLDLTRLTAPEPWQEGDNIPWDEPGFSERMLQEHLSQAHDAASRRFTRIDQHVAWIHQAMLGGKPGRVLDLGCGPGLYASRLAQLGHRCRGIDFSPASIAYARQTASQLGLDCSYVLQDVRQAEFGSGFDLAMMIFGEFNVFKPGEAARLLEKACRALNPGGKLLLEVHTLPVVKHLLGEGSAWRAVPGGLFSPRPHLLLEQGFWDEAQQAATRRYFVIDAETGDMERYAASYQGYTDVEYLHLLETHGFAEVCLLPGMGTDADDNLCVLTGRRLPG
jgi:SAM-dependent methyltransferase